MSFRRPPRRWQTRRNGSEKRFMTAIADSGFIASVFAKSNPNEQQWALSWLRKASLPLLTSAVNIFQAGWLINNPEGIMRLVVEGDYKLALDFDAESEIGRASCRERV